MPQLDPSSFISQIFWLAISFTILFFIVVKLIVPNILQIITERNNIIENDLNKAEQAKINAETIEKLYKDSIENAHHKANKLIEEAKLQIKEESRQKMAILSTELNLKLKEAENKIMSLQENASKDIEILATDIVKSIYSKKLNSYIEQDELNRILNEMKANDLKG
ncbi:MAG: hypothetical protein ACK4OM_06335 [Alphaproteobacteria bacterium]